MRRLPAAAAALLAFCALAVVPAIGQVNVEGQWAVSFSTNYGRGASTMSLRQEGTRLTGYIVTARNETPLKGTIEADRFSIVWEQLMEGEMVPVRFEGVVKDNAMNGTVKLGDFAEGPFYAERR